MSDNCKFCGMAHGVQCPVVKAIEYYENGSIKRVEYKTAPDFPPASAHPYVYPYVYNGPWYEGPRLTGVANSYGPIINVQQRVHNEDVSGHWLDNGEKIELPQYYDDAASPD